MDHRTYKRSWRNLLINKRYQLRFTLFMVGLCAVLMAGLGWWVMKVANETTQVARNRVLGTVCADVKLFAESPEDAFAPPEPTDLPPTPMTLPAQAQEPTPAPAAVPVDTGSAGSAAPAPDDEEAARQARRSKIVVDSTPMEMLGPPISKHFVKSIGEKWGCKFKQAASLSRLENGRMRILYVMIFVGLVLVVFLAGYGIKMTHKVAGPLFKVGLYHAKMREGRFDKVYNLRKGDQLVSFYDHFKAAHAGVVAAEEAEIKQLKAVIAAAEAAGAGEDPAVEELRAMLARKEKALA
ncbi:MAG: hypothetical protein KF773_14865 [Deltaproteobacteria bacterium]|nr:hypothetical protein [Deltaproteobacteria bacterium]